MGGFQFQLAHDAHGLSFSLNYYGRVRNREV